MHSNISTSLFVELIAKKRIAKMNGMIRGKNGNKEIVPNKEYELQYVF